MKDIGKYSIGTGDRFGVEGVAQIAAFAKLKNAGVDAAIVWNKSNREHVIIGSDPADQRASADEAIKKTGWKGPYCVDADHIGLKTVDRFIPYCDFFTIDVADFIGKPAKRESIEEFVKSQKRLLKPGFSPLLISAETLEASAAKYLLAVQEAGKVFERISLQKPDGKFLVEVSMDETDIPQTPAELAVILAALSKEGVPVQTIAPKFTGRFNKGVDYVGNVGKFVEEFENDTKVVMWASEALGLPEDLRLSVHSGSDKFSIYPGIRDTLKRLGAGIHLKTAGTTWLEELVGLAEAGGEGLEMAKNIYVTSYGRYDELAAPYVSVLDIDRSKLPAPASITTWSSERFVAALRHDEANPEYNPNLRQLLHVGYKVAAELGTAFMSELQACRDSIAVNVEANLWERHLRPLFLG
jgi:hypothetical protein